MAKSCTWLRQCSNSLNRRARPRRSVEVVTGAASAACRAEKDMAIKLVRSCVVEGARELESAHIGSCAACVTHQGNAARHQLAQCFAHHHVREVGPKPAAVPWKEKYGSGGAIGSL